MCEFNGLASGACIIRLGLGLSMFGALWGVNEA